jgi:hypothetical protein
MVNDNTTDDIVSWNEKGDAFLVKKEHEFASKVLPKYFRHRNFSSFVRQLNFYGFRKRSNQSKYSQFKHKYFKRGQPDQLCLIKRKAAEASMFSDVFFLFFAVHVLFSFLFFRCFCERLFVPAPKSSRRAETAV